MIRVITKLNVGLGFFCCVILVTLLSQGCNDDQSTSEPAEKPVQSYSTTEPSNEIVLEEDVIDDLLWQGSEKNQVTFSFSDEPDQDTSALVMFSNEIVLENYAITEAGGHTMLELTWRGVFTNPNENYFVFVHGLGEKDKILFQFDHQLFNADGKPTSQWDQTLVKDNFKLSPPAGYPPGKYTLRLGVWVPQKKRTLPIWATNLTRAAGDHWYAHSVLLKAIDCR